MQETKPQTSLPALNLDDLLDLAENLRALGFVIETGQILNAQRTDNLLAALAAENASLPPRRLCALLAPIFCTTVEEQETFYSFFPDWLDSAPSFPRESSTSFPRRRESLSLATSSDSRLRGNDAAALRGNDGTTSAKRAKLPLSKGGRGGCLGLFSFLQRSRNIPRAPFKGGIFAAILLSIAVLTYIFWPPPEPKFTAISGTVIHALDGTALDDVRARLNDDATQTDSAGQFRFEKFPTDSIAQLSFAKTGFLTNTAVPEKAEKLQLRRWRLWPDKGEQSVTVNVLDNDTRAPIAGARVMFENQADSTGGDGAAAFRYQPSMNVIFPRAEHPNYFSASVSFLLHGHHADEPTLALTRRPPAPEDSLRALVARINAFADRAAKNDGLSENQRWFLTNFKQIKYSGAAVPALLFLFWLIWRWRKRRLLLEKQTTRFIPHTETITVEGAADYLFRNTAYRRTMQQMRLHREIASQDLDAPKTVAATIENGGLFTPEFAARQVSPEYLVLIDRTSFLDQHAQFLDALIRRMAKDGLFIDRYFFDGDPRACRSDDLEAHHLTIEDLLRKHPKHRLLIFSDGKDFIDPYTGRPQAWLNDFLEWESGAVFIPDKTEGADFLESALTDMGFDVGAAGVSGLTRHIERLRRSGREKAVDWEKARQFPALVAERIDLWLHRGEPEERDIAGLLDDLENYLETEGFHWLCACAVYPELHWELTLYLATRLRLGDEHTLSEDAQLEVRRRLRDLTRLPWFREGMMPDWLRLRLIAAMQKEQHAEVKTIVHKLLATARDEKRGGKNARRGFELKYASQTAVERLKNLVLGRLRRDPGEELQHDAVFAHYMSARSPGKLAVRVPERVKKLFFRRGQAALGVNPVSAFLLAAFFSTAGWFGGDWLKPAPQNPPPIPKFAMLADSAAQSFSAPAARSDSSLRRCMTDFQKWQTDPSLVFPPAAIDDSSSIMHGEDSTFFAYTAWLAAALRDSAAYDSAQFSLRVQAAPDSTTTIYAAARPLFITLNDNIKTTPRFDAIQQNDTLTITQKRDQFRTLGDDAGASLWERTGANQRFAEIDSLLAIFASLSSPNDFLTCRNVVKLNPSGVTSTFSPGRVFIFARVNAPRAESVTFRWLIDGAMARTQTLRVRRAPSFRIHDNLRFAADQFGRHEARLYNAGGLLIGRRVFNVIPDRTPQTIDLTLRHTADNPTPTLGDTVTYTLTLRNNGPATARNITLSDTLPAMLVPQTNRGMQTEANLKLNIIRLTWRIPTLAPGDSLTRQFSARVKDLPPDPLRGIVTTAGAAAAGQTDANPANNISSVMIVVQDTIDFTAQQQASNIQQEEPAVKNADLPQQTALPADTNRAALIGIEWIDAPGGTFRMGDLWGDGDDDEKPVHQVTLSPFRMSKHEITNAQFCVFLNEKGNREESGTIWLEIDSLNSLIEYRNGFFAPKAGYENHPVIDVSWYGAKAFAEWLGGRLPTEAEWEYAARAGGREIKWPWGNDFDGSKLNSGDADDGYLRTAPVGSFPPNALGLHDMAGNVWEWCNDWFGDYSSGAQTDPVGAAQGVDKVVRGGSWVHSVRLTRTTYRYWVRPRGRSSNMGFRVVLSRRQ